MNTEIITTLNNLIEIAKDGKEGFGNAAKNVTDQEFKSILFKIAEGYRKAVLKLQKHLAKSQC
ncbi:MAG: DUF2383 domain-containing protein [Rickettsiaceae bacterium]|nr:DUF2383 domain-containing protein [Rickettsiales bacterium]MCP5378663.1 DUF2383 domain-containing protein [Rickettsiaceae bacterium]